MERPKPAPRNSALQRFEMEMSGDTQQNDGKQTVPQNTAWIEDEIQETNISFKNEIRRRETTFIVSPSRNERKQRSKVSKTKGDPSRRITELQESASVSSLPSALHVEQSPVTRSNGQRSADDSSVDGSRSQTPHNRSYRDRIRERIESVREKAGNSIIRAKSRTHLPPLHSVRMPSEDHPEGEGHVAETLERREKTRVRWREAARNSRELASSDAAYDFFTQVWKEDDEPTVAQPGSPQSTSDDIIEDDENVKLTAADYLEVVDEWEIVQNVPAVLENAEEIKAREEALYFQPSPLPIPLEERLLPDCEIRCLESEGIYVGSCPSVAEHNLRLLEHRLLASGDKKWFGEDGEVIRLPDPRREYACRPLLFDQVESDVEYKQAGIQEYGKKMLMEEGCYLLTVNVVSIHFLHHSLFSREHVAAQRVVELYKSYTHNVSSRQQDILAGRLEALRRARDSLRESEDQSEQHLERLQRYLAEIKDTRQQYHIVARNNHQVFKRLIHDWRNLLDLRATQGYTSTSVHLNLVDVNVNESQQDLTQQQEEDELSRWNAAIKTEIRELIQERQEEYNEMFDEYKKQFAVWKQQRRARRQAAKSRRKSEADEITEAPTVSRVSPVEEMAEPTPPSRPDLKEIRAEVTEMYYENFRSPSEPNIRIELSYSEPVDSNPPCSKEQQRRAAVKRMVVFIKFLFNDREVCRSRPYSLGTKFSAELNLMVHILLAEWPDNLKLQVHELSGLVSTQLAEVFLALPGGSTTFPMSPVETVTFSCGRVVAHGHLGVGSGVAFTETVLGEERTTCLYTTGELNCRVGWAVDRDTGKTLAPHDKYLRHIRRNSFDGDLLGTNSTLDVQRLSEWAEKTHLDPNDPRNANFFHFIKNMSHKRGDTNYFRLDPLNAEFDFCTDEDLSANARLKLLRLRDRGEPEFRALRLIPNQEKEIDKDIFKKYYDARKSPARTGRDSVGPLDAHRACGWRFLQQVRQRVARQCSIARHYRNLQDIILEDQVPDISTLGLTFFKWLQPKRPLRPTRKERKKVTVQNLAGQEVNVIVSVVRAFEVPIRKEADSVPFSTAVSVRPFVEVSFRGGVARTTAADGSNPTWNQDLHLPLRPPSGDHSFGRIQEIQDCLFFHLFDETIVDLLEDDRMRDTCIHQRLERNWLGSLHIPFSTLYHNSKVEGTFKMYSPPVLLGYEREPQQRSFTGFNSSIGGLNSSTEAPLQRDATFLTLFITVQPALNPPEPFQEKLESSELEYMERHLDKWQNNMTSLYPHRNIKTQVLSSGGKAFCVTRFFRPLLPPVLDDDMDTTEEMVARFVSMIPVEAGSVLFPGLVDIWLTSEQVLWCLSGDCEDIAVLLCCYFLYLECPAWLLLGLGIPHGATAYVLTRDGDHKSEYEYWVWDPASGQKYSVLDSFCPLQKVYCIINEDNIWANVQREEVPRRTRYDVSIRDDWCPAFGRNISPPNGSVQPPALKYHPTSVTEVLRLQEKLEKHLRDSLMKWRRTSRTLWNRYCIAILRKILPVLERAAWTAAESSTGDNMEELQEIQKSHKMCGFPINLPYTNVEAVTEAVKATGVHHNQNVDVEFALAVYIHPFPNNVLSVWVYVAALTRRR